MKSYKPGGLPFTMLILLTVVLLGTLTASVYAPNSSYIPPQGYTGATGFYCTSCHASYPLNSGGGSVSLSGISGTGFDASQSIPFSVLINHGAADRTRWGFSIKAVNSAGAPIGSFSSANASAAVNGSELSHFNAPITPAQSSYNFSGLSWTAPANISGNNNTVRFYVVGNAAYANGSSSLDYIYSNSITLTANAPLPCDTAYWTGTLSTAWETAANWSCGAVPGANTVVFINAAAIRFPVISSAATCKKIITAIGANLEVSPDYSLIVTGQDP